MIKSQGNNSHNSSGFYIIVDETWEIQEIIGDPGGLIQLPRGIVSRELFSLIDSRLLPEIRQLTLEATKSKKETKSSILRLSPEIESDEEASKRENDFIQIRIQPHSNSSGQFTYYLYFLFFSHADFINLLNFTQTSRYPDEAKEHIQMLEEELDRTKRSVNSYIEKLEEANRSLLLSNDSIETASGRYQRLNEQLEASNEELRVSNEELHHAYAEVSKLNKRLKESQKELTRKEETLRAMIDNVPGVIFSVIIDSDLDMDFTYISPKIQSIFGVNIHKAYEQPQMAFPIPPEDKEDFKLELKKAMEESEHWDSQGRFQYEDGRIVYWKSHASLIRWNSGKIKMDGVIMNTTRQVEMEETANRIRNEFNDAVKDVIAVVFKFKRREDGEYIYVINDGFIGESLGITTDRVAGKTLSEVVGEEEAVKLRKNYDRAYFGEKVEYEFTFWDRWYYSRILKYEENGTTVGVVGSAIDITEKRKLEDRFSQSQKMETIGYLAGGIAHDLNNMLQPIFIYSNILKEELLEKKLPQETIEKVHRILGSVDRAKKLVIQILDFSRNKTPEDSKKEKLGLPEALRENLNLLLMELPSHIESNIRLDIEPNSAIYIDPVKFTQVLMNLINNAIYAMKIEDEHKKVLSILATTESDIPSDWKSSTKILESNKYHILRISDTGTGIKLDKIQKVFEPFFSQKTKGEGLGLGLSIVKGIMENIGGGIDVSSQPNQGTTFRMIFPAMDSTDSEQESLLPGEETNRNKSVYEGRVLLVDDDEFTVESIFDLLELKSIPADVVDDPEKGIEIFLESTQKYSLIITDYKMPSMTGVEFIEKIRNTDKTIPIILYSGNTLPISESFLETNQVVLLEKPLDADVLLRNIQNLTEKK